MIGTGDLSELALGWCTYNGDHMSMYGVNGGVPKTLVRYIVDWYALARLAETGGGTAAPDPARAAQALRDILATPVSPELLPANADGSIAHLTEQLVLIANQDEMMPQGCQLTRELQPNAGGSPRDEGYHRR